MGSLHINSDATWHVLLTVECYNQTPIDDHIFLPIVSLGKPSDKWISWGATVPDKKGNYYYTSFSPAGYVAPWAFFKLFNLETKESNLFIFSSVIYCLSSILWVFLLSQIFRNSLNRNIICFIGGLLYISAPEILHSMGIVYWHQTLMQVTLLFQIISYLKCKTTNSRISKNLFLTMAIVNPYIEWTGYVANVGFALAELLFFNKGKLKRKITNISILGGVSLFSFTIFSIHYCLRIPLHQYISALKARFLARNISTNVPFSNLLNGYFESYRYIWIVLLIAILVFAIKNRNNYYSLNSIYQNNKDKIIILFITAFPVIENIIMKQHAVAYTFDRLKLSWSLIILVCFIIDKILKDLTLRNIILILSIVVLFLNYRSYTLDHKRIWKVEYKQDNAIYSSFVNTEFPDAHYCCNSAVRGYINLLFGRGITEGINENTLRAYAIKNAYQEIILINREGYRIKNIEHVKLSNTQEILDRTKYRVVNHKMVMDKF